jgi:MFS superfamily sulfate permease-like transporter
LGNPRWDSRDVDGVLGLALACFLLAYIESISAARTLALKNNYPINPRQELLALGVANVATAFSSGFPVAGGLSQSSVNDKAGAKTQLALVVSSVTLGVLLLFFTGLLKNLPTVVLAAVVLDAVTGLVKVKELKRLRQLSKFEFGIAMIAFIGVLLFGILKGILLAVILSLILLIRRTAHPHVAVLGKIPGTDRYSDIERNPDNVLVDGIMIFRVEASIIYFNVESVSEDIWKHITKAGNKLKLVILDLSSSPYVDVSGTNFLIQLNNELKKKNVQFRMVEARARVRDILREQELEAATGPINRRISLNDIVEEFVQGK